MYTHLCPIQLLNQLTRRLPPPQPPENNGRPRRSRSQGQVLVIFAVSLVALLLFIGLAVDAGSIYLSYDQLKRAVDAAAVSAADDFKRGVSIGQMTTGAEEVLKLHNVDLGSVTLQVYTCDSTGLQANAPTLYALCNTTPPRKLVYVQATEQAPLYFLALLGVPPVALTTNSLSEAAPIDMVIVMDTSNSMGINSSGYVANDYNPDSGANACNPTNSCYPLRSAKDAAKDLINKGLYQNYDRVAVVKVAQIAQVVHSLDTNLGQGDTDSTCSHPPCTAESDIDNHVTLHYDPPEAKMWTTWQYASFTDSGGTHTIWGFNPTNPEDRSGNSGDANAASYTAANGSYPVCADYKSNGGNPPANAATLAQTGQSDANCCWPNLPATPSNPWPSRWDYLHDPFGWGGVPCDEDSVTDSYNWSKDNGGQGPYDPINDPAGANAWLTAHNFPSTGDPENSGSVHETLSPLSTCSGCGIRVAADLLKDYGRPTAVWIIVYLSDGGVNMSDTPQTDPARFQGALTTAYPNGFCSGALGTAGDMHYSGSTWSPQGWWYDGCNDKNIYARTCINATDSNGHNTCPPSYTTTGGTASNSFTTTWSSSQNNGTSAANWQYSPLDYAMDMVDQAALTVTGKNMPASGNSNYYNQYEAQGNDIAIYSIGVGNALGANGEAFLRYMAAVGDDGDRVTDPCGGKAAKQDCGDYYWSDGSDNSLSKIFEDIASRIYTRISG